MRKIKKKKKDLVEQVCLAHKTTFITHCWKISTSVEDNMREYKKKKVFPDHCYWHLDGG